MKHPGEKRKVKIIPSSSVILLRTNQKNTNTEIFLAKRKNNLKYFPGLYSGIGGKIEKTDLNLAKEFEKQDILSLPRQKLNHIICAWRELLEEIGIFYYDSINFGLKNDVFAYTGKNPSINLQDLIKNYDLDLKKFLLDDFLEAGFRNTPEFTNIQFGTQFYFLYINSIHHIPRIGKDNPEFESGTWDTPQNFFQKIKNFEYQTSPPVLAVIRALTKFPLVIVNDAGKYHPIMASNYLKNKDSLPIGIQVRIEAHPGIEVIPFKSQTRPPATTTNLISIGYEKKILIDPGTHFREEIKRLDLIIDKWLEGGDEIMFQTITHHHEDHWQAALHLKDKYEIPIALHPNFNSNFENVRLPADITLTHNYEIDLGKDKYNNLDWKLNVLFLPGHANDHIAIIDQRFGAFICGDIIAGTGTVIIEDYDDYMNTLEYLASLNITTLFPGHGPIIKDGNKTIIDYIKHRKTREEMILNFLKISRFNTLSEITSNVYKDIPVSFHVIAEHQVRVYMDYFKKKNLVVYDEIQNSYELI
jgi:glyoxylase-like metal-dependent hydrolase (beta-lactamase superfamily II)/8-oxo-dGTP pyrophosphatase MutT (NUDIX family)